MINLLKKYIFLPKLIGAFVLVVVSSGFRRPVAAPPDSHTKPPFMVPTLISADVPDVVNHEETVGRFFFVDESLHQVLDMLSDLTGKKILAAENVSSSSIQITFDSEGEMTKSEAVVALESLLNLNGVGIAEMGDNFIRVMLSNTVRFKSPDLIEGSSLDLIPSEKIYSKIFKLRFLSLEEGNTLLANRVSQGVGYVELIKSNNSILVTDSLVNIQQIEKLLIDLDQPSQQEIIIRKLQNTSAESLKNKLTESVTNTLGSFIEGSVSIDADERSNQIVVVTDPQNKSMIEHLISIYDVDMEPLTVSEVLYLKHAEANEMVKIIDSVISGQKKVQQDKLKSRNDNTAGSSAELSEVNANEDMETDDSVSNLQFSPYVTVVADERSNAVIAYGTKNDLKFLKQIIGSIDVVLSQVRIDVIITEVTLTGEDSRGIDRFGISYDENDEISLRINEDSDLPFNMEGTVEDLLLKPMTVANFTMGVVFDTAKKDANVKVVSSPTLVTTHNREAIINAGESRPVITSSNTDSTGLNTRSQVDFKDIGVQLKVKPLIGSNGMVQMEIEQVVENVVDEVLIDGNSQPVIGKREATSFVSVSSGQVVVLGGLQERNNRMSKSRMGGLGKIPLLGSLLFSSKRESSVTRELIIFIRPTVFNQAVDAESHGAELLEGKMDVIGADLFGMEPVLSDIE